MARSRSSLAYSLPPRSGASARLRFAPRHPRAFGRARTFQAAAVSQPASGNGDWRQLLNTFFGGLVFVGVLIA